MTVSGNYYSPLGAKRKADEHLEVNIPTRGQPIREGKKRFWTELFFEKTGIVLGKGIAKTVSVVKQDSIEFVLLKEKVDSLSPGHIRAVYEERLVQMILSRYKGFVTVIDSFFYRSRKDPNILKWMTLAEKFDGDFIPLPAVKYRHTHILELADRLNAIISEGIIVPDLKLDNCLHRGPEATITDFGGSYPLGLRPSRFVGFSALRDA